MREKGRRNKRERISKHTCNRPYSWYSPHSSIDMAEHDGGEEQEANIMHCAQYCGRGGAQEGGVNRAREGVREGDAGVCVVRSEGLR
jgi:hypothetical protein